MTKKHFEAFAAYIKRLDGATDDEREMLIKMVTQVARQFNGNFDSGRFRSAAEGK